MSQIYELPLVLEPQLLPELISEGDNIQAALQNADDALSAIFEALDELKQPLSAALLPKIKDDLNLSSPL